MLFSFAPTVPQCHKDRVTIPSENPADPRRAPRRPRRTLEETPAEAPENPLRGKFPQRASQTPEGCAPRMVTLPNFNVCSRCWRSSDYCKWIAQHPSGAPLAKGVHRNPPLCIEKEGNNGLEISD